MAGELKILCPAASNSNLVLPPNGRTVFFDAQGVSEPVDQDTYDTTLTVAGFDAVPVEEADSTDDKPGTRKRR